jgi:hypothetical protein
MLHKLGIYYRALFNGGVITKTELNGHLGRLNRYYKQLENERNARYNASVRTARTRTVSNRTRHS